MQELRSQTKNRRRMFGIIEEENCLIVQLAMFKKSEGTRELAEVYGLRLISNKSQNSAHNLVDLPQKSLTQSIIQRALSRAQGQDREMSRSKGAVEAGECIDLT